ncbi:MAG: adenylate cyclase, partial [Lachnospiraceae bacterium]|nr:adenylate cyclase [Lachnospiraceae bacterium]
PVGAVAVHMLNGIWGTLAVGLFATSSAPGFALAGIGEGLFYGGGAGQLIKQAGGMLITAAWTAVTVYIAFTIIKHTVGLRVTEEEEIEGLDAREHGLASAYAGFSILDMTGLTMIANDNTSLGIADYDQASEAARKASVPVENVSDSLYGSSLYTGINKVVIITKLSRYDKIKKALNELGVTGITVTQVTGCGIQKGAGQMYRGVEMDMTLLPKIKLEVVVSKIPVDSVIETAKRTLYTGKIGDGKIFVYPVSRVVKIRTGEENYDALQDVE